MTYGVKIRACYKPNGEVRRLKNPRTVSGDPVLRGFTLNLAEIWEPDL